MFGRTTLTTAIAILIIGGCTEKSPKRDQIPLLRAQLLNLQTAVKNQNPAAIDSLLSVRTISKKQGADSLLSFVYGPDGNYPFERFGNYSIVYTKDRARIECYIMDSSAQTGRPVTLYLAHEHDMWLFTGFAAGVAESADSTER